MHSYSHSHTRLQNPSDVKVGAGESKGHDDDDLDNLSTSSDEEVFDSVHFTTQGLRLSTPHSDTLTAEPTCHCVLYICTGADDKPAATLVHDLPVHTPC